MARSPLAAMPRVFANAFKGKLKSGVIRRETATTTDAAGDAIAADPANFSFEGLRESFDAAWAQSAGIPVTHSKILVLLGSVKPQTNVLQGDLIFLEGSWWKCERILDTDPASVTSTLQCSQVAAP